MDDFSVFRRRVSDWIAVAEDKLLSVAPEVDASIKPEDSVSNVGSQSSCVNAPESQKMWRMKQITLILVTISNRKRWFCIDSRPPYRFNRIGLLNCWLSIRIKANFLSLVCPSLMGTLWTIVALFGPLRV